MVAEEASWGSGGTMRLPARYSELTWQERRKVRLRYIFLQDGKCFYCMTSLNGPQASWVSDRTVNPSLFPPNFFDHPIHLQHDHDTDLTEGAVHAYCNAVMWQYEGR